MEDRTKRYVCAVADFLSRWLRRDLTHSEFMALWLVFVYVVGGLQAARRQS